MTDIKPHIIRNYYPGDNWLFVKVYGGIVMCDRLLVTTVYPLMLKLKKNGIIGRWFFIRYSDPEFHLRIRVELTNPNKCGDAIQAFNSKFAPLCMNRRLHKIVIDTYEREIERYGKRNMDFTETLFHFDSICSCRIIQLLTSLGLEDQRWKLSFVIVDTILDVLNYSLEEKIDKTRAIKEGYQREFGFDEHNIKQLASHYRKNKKEVFLIFNASNEIYGCRKIINRYKNDLKKCIVNENVSTLNVSSLLHMSMNRLFASKNRLNELMVYYCLDKYYHSEIIRNKNS